MSKEAMVAHSEAVLRRQGFSPDGDGWVSADRYWLASITDKPTSEIDGSGRPAPLGFVIAYRKAK